MKRSIEETINYRLLFMGMVSLVLTAALTIFVFHRSFSHQVEHDLELTTRSVASSYTLSGDERILEVSAQDTLRITLIAQDGSVLYDSAAGTALENHLERPEVQQALHGDNGVGISQRESSTVGYRTYYCALRLENGNVLRLGLDAASTYGFFDEALPAIVISCMVILGLSVLASWLLTRSLVRPIVQMGEDLEHIEDHVPYAELVPFAQTIQSDQLLRQNNERMRREFTANVSHELKTPLTSIRGFVETLKDGAIEDPKMAHRFLDIIDIETERLSHLISDTLLLSEIESKQDTNREPCDVNAVIAEVVELLQPKVKEHVRLIFQPEAVCGGERHLRRGEKRAQRHAGDGGDNLACHAASPPSGASSRRMRSVRIRRWSSFSTVTRRPL